MDEHRLVARWECKSTSSGLLLAGERTSGDCMGRRERQGGAEVLLKRGAARACSCMRGGYIEEGEGVHLKPALSSQMLGRQIQRRIMSYPHECSLQGRQRAQ